MENKLQWQPPFSNSPKFFKRENLLKLTFPAFRIQFHSPVFHKKNKKIIMPCWAVRFFHAQCVTIPVFSSGKFFKYFFLWSSWGEEHGSHFTNNSCPRNMKDLCSFIQYLNSEHLAASGDVGVVTATAEDVAGMDKAQVLALPRLRPAARLSLFRAVC